MKYLYKTAKGTLENMNEAAWVRCLGRPVQESDTTTKMCHMVEDENGAELHIEDGCVQHFTSTVQAQMTDTPQIVIEEEA